MIDLHSHILPGLDDGATDITASIEMAKIACENATNIIAATPHSYYLDSFHPGNEARAAKSVFEKFKSALEENNICLKTVLGMEILGDRDTAQRLLNLELLTLNNTQFPLIEFGFDVDEDFIWNVLMDVKSAGYHPVLAHPERYDCLYENPSFAFDLYKEDIILQVNKGSILGHFGKRVEKVAHIFLRHRLAALIASDAHNTYSRTPNLEILADYIDYNFGEGCSPLLLEENPRRIINGEEIIWADPIPF